MNLRYVHVSYTLSAEVLARLRLVGEMSHGRELSSFSHLLSTLALASHRLSRVDICLRKSHRVRGVKVAGVTPKDSTSRRIL